MADQTDEDVEDDAEDPEVAADDVFPVDDVPVSMVPVDDPEPDPDVAVDWPVDFRSLRVFVDCLSRFA